MNKVDKKRKDTKMDIDDIIDILCYGNKEEIEKIIKDNKISYSFAECGEYTIYNGGTYEIVRGHGIGDPNCIKYFGRECDWRKIIKK